MVKKKNSCKDVNLPKLRETLEKEMDQTVLTRQSSLDYIKLLPTKLTD